MADSNNIIELGAHDNMTPEEVMEYVLRRADRMKSVIIIGYDVDGDFIMNCSKISREDANMLCDLTKHDILFPITDILEESAKEPSNS